MNMNRYEHRYRWTGWALIVLLGVWVGAMLLALALPAGAWKIRATPLIFFAGVFPILLTVAIVLGVMRMIAYIRWTGKYPYYFLFGKARGSGDDVNKGEEGARPEKDNSA
jgi:hypothetical protein